MTRKAFNEKQRIRSFYTQTKTWLSVLTASISFNLCSGSVVSAVTHEPPAQFELKYKRWSQSGTLECSEKRKLIRDRYQVFENRYTNDSRDQDITCPFLSETLTKVDVSELISAIDTSSKFQSFSAAQILTFSSGFEATRKTIENNLQTRYPAYCKALKVHGLFITKEDVFLAAQNATNPDSARFMGEKISVVLQSSPRVEITSRGVSPLLFPWSIRIADAHTVDSFSPKISAALSKFFSKKSHAYHMLTNELWWSNEFIGEPQTALRVASNSLCRISEVLVQSIKGKCDWTILSKAVIPTYPQPTLKLNLRRKNSIIDQVVWTLPFQADGRINAAWSELDASVFEHERELSNVKWLSEWKLSNPLRLIVIRVPEFSESGDYVRRAKSIDEDAGNKCFVLQEGTKSVGVVYADSNDKLIFLQEDGTAAKGNKQFPPREILK